MSTVLLAHYTRAEFERALAAAVAPDPDLTAIATAIAGYAAVLADAVCETGGAPVALTLPRPCGHHQTIALEIFCADIAASGIRILLREAA